jgi:hypothetical protein
MSKWPPTIYEINTSVWLSELSERKRTCVDLSSVPSAEWDAIAAYGFDAVWLMGVWERSPAGVAIANRDENLLNDFRRALPNFRQQDNVGSAYCVRRHVVDAHLGGPTVWPSPGGNLRSGGCAWSLISRPIMWRRTTLGPPRPGVLCSREH